MSLGAKELFHTNFLAFLLESQDQSVSTIQKKLKELLFGHGNVGRVITWREKESLDLVIMPAPIMSKGGDAELDYDCTGKKCKYTEKKCTDYCDTIAVVIEAKLKSIPTPPQLVGYDEKLIKGIDFELDEVDTVNVLVGQDERTWQVMRLKLEENVVDATCNSKCTIEARGKKTDGGSAGNIKTFCGTVRRLLLRPLSLSTNDCAALPLKEKMGCWEQMSWQCVVDALKCDRHEDPCEALSETNQLRKCKEIVLLPRCICDYRDSLQQLLSILDQTYEYVKSSVRASGHTYSGYYKAITDAQFKTYRIHDLVGKYASHILERHIMDFVCGALASIGGNGQNCKDCSLLNDHSSQTPSFTICDVNFKLNSYTHFSNQQPGVGFEWLAIKKDGRKERRISFGVQIQGNEYRHFICVEGGNDVQRKSILDGLAKILGTGQTDWFLNGQVFNLAPPPKFEKKPLKVGEVTFYVFDGSKFRYSKAGISNLPLPDLAQAVCHSLCLARQLVSTSNAACVGMQELFKPDDDNK
jgi:hypothetical protein